MTKAPRGARGRSAAEWFVAMHGPEADAERAAFDDWHARAANAAAYARIEATWSDSRFLANSPVGRGRNLARARRKLPAAVLLAAGIAAITLVPLGLVAERSGWFGPPVAERPATDEFAAGDAVQVIRLVDGSRVTLDRGARLRDLGSTRERRFLLLRGRARFEVAHDPTRPFYVDAGAGRVVAHGTVFDVAIEGDAVRVLLLKGSVEVRDRAPESPSPRAARFLAPGEQLVVTRGDVGLPAPASGALLDWPEVMISFDDAPLGDAIRTFNRAGGRTVRLEGEALASRRLSGAFRRNDPQGFAEALAASFGLEVRTEPDGSLMLRTRAPTSR